MHYDFESTVRDSSKRIAEENRQGKIEAAVELKVAHIRTSFAKLETLSKSYDPLILSNFSALVELNKPTIAHDILEAKNLLLELKQEIQRNAEQMKIQSIADYKFEMQQLKSLEFEISQLEARLMSEDEFFVEAEEADTEEASIPN